MFQFPGFAFITLCIQVINTWFNHLLIAQAINRGLSGGLPHSEIGGSKPILGSPPLIAEYHVLHRLLLPRHPPNALLALDLIQKKTGFFCDGRSLPCGTAAPRIPSGTRGDQKHTIPLPFLVREEELWRRPKAAWVSVLDLDSIMPRGSNPQIAGALPGSA